MLLLPAGGRGRGRQTPPLDDETTDVMEESLFVSSSLPPRSFCGKCPLTNSVDSNVSIRRIQPLDSARCTYSAHTSYVSTRIQTQMTITGRMNIIPARLVAWAASRRRCHFRVENPEKYEWRIS